MKYVTYLTHYTGDKLPPFYIGSTNNTRIEEGYNGSVDSKKWKTIYKQEQLENKHLFKTRILSTHNTREDALKEELRLQLKHEVVKNERYFNESYAQENGAYGRDQKGELNPNFGKTASEKTRKKIGQATQNRNDIKYGKLTVFKVPCSSAQGCDNIVEVEERAKLFPKKEKYFCSKKCSYARIITEERKEHNRKKMLDKL